MANLAAFGYMTFGFFADLTSGQALVERKLPRKRPYKAAASSGAVAVDVADPASPAALASEKTQQFATPAKPARVAQAPAKPIASPASSQAPARPRQAPAPAPEHTPPARAAKPVAKPAPQKPEEEDFFATAQLDTELFKAYIIDDDE